VEELEDVAEVGREGAHPSADVDDAAGAFGADEGERGLGEQVPGEAGGVGPA
jgi:hypothetical protein